ncbi:MAG: tetratricopeptide repeat protein [Caldilineales bacterium]|nr:tetratricopeptide repeat protein [Caldilineales bacterium]MDW8317556.1 tetratricopeptide repeat protein [Anaerolineae bacterium]
MVDAAASLAPATSDLRERFRRKIALNADHYLRFVEAHRYDPQLLAREMANIVKAAELALSEEGAWQSGIALVESGQRLAELRGHLGLWRALTEQALAVCRRLAAAGLAEAAEHEGALLDNLGEIARTLGETGAAKRYFEAALERYRAIGRPAGVGRVLAHLSQVYLHTGDVLAADRCCAEAASVLAEDDLAELALLYNNWGLVTSRLRRTEEAQAHYRQAEALFARLGNVRGQAKVLNNLGQLYYEMGRPEAEAYFLRALELYRRLGDDPHAARTQVNLGAFYHDILGRTEHALQLHQAVEPVFRRLGDRLYQAHTKNNIGVFLADLGRREEAREAYQQAAQLYLELDDRTSAAGALANLAEVLLDLGHQSEAAASLVRARTLLDGVDHPPRWVTTQFAALAARLDPAADGQTLEPQGGP